MSLNSNSKLIDQAFSNVCDKLKNFDKQLNENFLQLTTNFDRFKFVWCIGFMHTELDSLFEKASFDPKDEPKAAAFRLKGNDSYKEKKFYEALLKYNQSIRQAPVKKSKKANTNTKEEESQEEGDNDLSMAYANRSAVFFHINEYELSLNDINTSFKFDYPIKLKQKLIERKVNCLFQLGRYKEIPVYLKSEASVDLNTMKDFLIKLDEIIKEEEDTTEQYRNKNKSLFQTYGNISFEIANKNNRMPNASNAITIDYSLDQGFFLKATKDIEIGDVVVDEKPYASVILGDQIETHCAECMVLLNLLKMNIANCRQCSRVQYCSSDCERAAWKSHHQYECKYFNLLADDSGITHMEWLALRIVLKAGLSYLKSMKPKLLLHEKNYENFKRDENSLKTLEEINEQYKSDAYLTVFNLITNSGLRPPKDLFRRAFVTLFMVKFLINTGYFGKPSKETADDACFIGGLILRHLQSISCNAHEVSRLKLSFKPGKAMQESAPIAIGAGIYSILSLFNHSCDPSVTRYFRGNRCQVRAIKGINKNEEIFDNYGVVFAVNEITERQEKLIGQYYFQCVCKACIEDWPKFDKLPSELHTLNLKLKCNECKKLKKPVAECADCQLEFDNLLLQQLAAQQSMKALLKFNLSTDIEDEPVQTKLEEIYESFCSYMKKLEQCGVKRPFQDYNIYQEALKQTINFINRY